MEKVKAFENVSGRVIFYKFVPRRSGVIAMCWANTTLVKQLLNWKVCRGLEQICSDTWRSQK
jgi:UDP-glucose 4-epimerase